jgi:tRNA uridine 5-carboxymethylaminomethyl modification enzyme
MFTSRAEYRLLLREDNADLRLMEKGYQLGLIEDELYGKLKTKRKVVRDELHRLKETVVYPQREVNEKLARLNTAPLRNVSCLRDLLKRPELSYRDLCFFDASPPELSDEIVKQVEIQVKYQGYIDRQRDQVERFKKLEGIVLPAELDYNEVPGLSQEAREKLVKIRPYTLGQTSRISGITPAAISILMIYLKKIGCL